MPEAEEPSKSGEEEARLKAEKEALYARRRNSLTGQKDAAAQKDARDEAAQRRATPRKKGVSPAVKWLAVAVFGLGGVGGGAFFGLRYRAEHSTEGLVRRQLGAFELAGRNVAGQDAAMAELDKLGAKGLDQVLVFLADTNRVEIEGSRSDRTMQVVANTYLLRLAQNVKADPPPVALEIKKSLFDGQQVPPAKWGELQGAWRGWIDAARGRGALPKA